jgi:hypothetical protein
MKLQGSEVQNHETLQSQFGKIAENRLPLSGLEIFHGRLGIVCASRVDRARAAVADYAIAFTSESGPTLQAHTGGQIGKS